MLTDNALTLLTLTFLRAIPSNTTTTTEGKEANIRPYVNTLGEKITQTSNNVGFYQLFNSPNTQTFPVVSSGKDVINITNMLENTSTLSSLTSSSNTFYSPYIFCGEGDTSPTREDYCLESPLNFTKNSITRTIDDTGILTASMTFTNNYDEPKTIREVCYCLMLSVGMYPRDYTPAKNLCMLSRKVLDEPITVQPNEVFTINYTMDFISISD